jgi:hypothetical protein
MLHFQTLPVILDATDAGNLVIYPEGRGSDQKSNAMLNLVG